MQGLQMFIEGVEVDPPENFSAQFTYSVDDIRNFAARNTAFSKSIILPFTAKNKALFGHIYQINSGNYLQTGPNVGYSFNPATRASAAIFLDGIQVFKGVIRLLEIVIDEQGPQSSFETCVTGELGGLITAIGEKLIESLDFSAYNHTFNLANIINSWSAPLGAGYHYPLIDYGYSIDKINFPVETFRPALHVKEYIDKIFSEAGFTYSSTFLNTDYFKRLIMPFNGEAPTRAITTALSLVDDNTQNMSAGPGASTSIRWQSWNPPQDIFSTTDFIHWQWQRGEAVKLKLAMSGAYSKPFGCTMSIGYELTDLDGSNPRYEYVGQVKNTIGIPDAGNFSFTVSIEIPANTQIRFYVYGEGGTGLITITGSSLQLSGQPTVNIPIKLGEAVDFKNFLPRNLTRLDFLKSVIKLFNLMIWEDKSQAGRLYIEPWVNYYQTAQAPQDWSLKLDRSKPYRLKPMGELNSRVFNFSYKADSDYYNQTYKDRYNEIYGAVTYDTGLDQVKETSKVEVIFSPSPLVGFKGIDRVITAIYKQSDSGTLSRMAHNPRLLFRSAVPRPCGTWYIKASSSAGAATIGTLTAYPYAGHLDNPDAPANDLNFGTPQELYFALLVGSLQNTLFNQFYSHYVGEITDKDSKLLTGDFYLTPSDIAALDFSKIIFIDGGLFRLNKVEDYTTDQPAATKCELLKVIDLIN